jgi:hypothetical protein
VSRHPPQPPTRCRQLKLSERLFACATGDEVNDVMKTGLAQLVEISAHIKETFEAATGAFLRCQRRRSIRLAVPSLAGR